MSAEVEPQEVAAVLDGVADAVRDAVQVAARDFRRPQRLSTQRLAALEQALRKPLTTLPALLAEVTGARLALGLGAVSEVSAEGLFDDATDATLLRFTVGGQPGWFRWEAGETAALAETMLGATDAKAAPRKLTRLEQRLVGEPLVTLVASLLQAVGASAEDFGFADTPADAGSWRDGGDGADAYRLAVELDVARADAEPSTATLYLPLAPELGAELDVPAAALPAHLAAVEVEVRCELARTEITLAQLLELEEGDVLATEARVDEPAQLLFEDRPIAPAQLGTHRGRFAVRVVPAGEPGRDPS